MKKGFFYRLGNISRVHHRAAFADVEHRINRLQGSNVFLELAAKRYSCREFNNHPVAAVKVMKMLEAARLAPSACNKQPVHVWAVTSSEALARLQAIRPIYGAPVVFLVGCKAEEAWVRSDGKNSAETDAAIVASHLMLAAADMELGGTWIGSFDPAKLAEAFPETAGYEITALIAAGHPAVNSVPSERHNLRKSMEEFATEL